MKKIVLILMIVSLCFAANSFAGDVTTAAAPDGVSTNDGEILFGNPGPIDIARASKGVKFAWSTGDLGYAIQTYHNSGTKLYGSAYDSTALYQKEVGPGFLTFAAPSDSTSLAFETGNWKEL